MTAWSVQLTVTGDTMTGLAEIQDGKRCTASHALQHLSPWFPSCHITRSGPVSPCKPIVCCRHPAICQFTTQAVHRLCVHRLPTS